MKVKWLVYILLTMMSIQLLPIKEVGKIFYKNLLLEELCANPDGEEKIEESSEDHLNPNYIISQIQRPTALIGETNINNQQFQSSMPSKIIHEVLTPPPLISA